MIKRLSIVDQIGNAGGASRFIRCLLPSLRKVAPKTEIVFFCNKTSVVRDQLSHELEAADITVRHLHTQFIRMSQIVNLIVGKLKPNANKPTYQFSTLFMKLLRLEIERKTSNSDIVFFPWPFLMLCPKLKCPMVATFHDFNFRYYFSGSLIFSPFQQYLLDQETPVWLQRSFPVVSTNFMAGELRKFYPEAADKTEVIHFSPLSTKTSLSDTEASRIVADELNIAGDYILYPTNTCAHKNIGPLINAMFLLRKMNRKVRMILTGPDTQKIHGRSCDIGIELGQNDSDVIGLGYVSNTQMDALIQCAKIVVSSSLYEAGNGPGIDAWAHAIPVAMSNIPPFLEHIETQGVRAKVFDPHNPQDIANKIEAILSDPKRAKEDALHSQQTIMKRTWDDVAEKYLNVFNRAIMEVNK